MLPVQKLDELYHIGSLSESRMKKESQEANFLSASLCPESWEFIARLGGEDVLTLRKSGARFVDMFSLSDDEMRHLMDEAVGDGFMEPAVWFKTWYYDGEADDWKYMALWDKGEAEYEVQDEEPDDAPNGVLVEEMSGHRMTDIGKSMLPRLPDDPSFSESAAVMLEVLRNPSLYDGVYWDEDDDPMVMSAPRFGISPSSLSDFTVSGPLGEMPFGEYVTASSDNDKRWDEPFP